MFLNFLGMYFCEDFHRFGMPKWSQDGTKMGSKINVTFERRFLIIRAPAAAGARKIKIWGWKPGANIEQKSIKNDIEKTIEKEGQQDGQGFIVKTRHQIVLQTAMGGGGCSLQE